MNLNQCSEFLSHHFFDRFVRNSNRLNSYVLCIFNRERKLTLQIILKKGTILVLLSNLIGSLIPKSFLQVKQNFKVNYSMTYKRELVKTLNINIDSYLVTINNQLHYYYQYL